MFDNPEQYYITVKDMHAIAPSLIVYGKRIIVDRVNQAVLDMSRDELMSLRALVLRLHDTEPHLSTDERVAVLELIMPAILKDLDSKIKKDIVAICLNDISALLNAGVELPNITQFLDENKKSIMTYVLGLIRKNKIDFANSVTELLKTLDINWQEIAIIEKSIGKQLNEGTFTIPPENVRREIAKYAANPRLAIGPLISALFTYRNIGGDLAAIELDAKELLLPKINKTVTKRNFYTVYRDLTQLAHLFNWDELRDIKIRMIPLFISELNRYEEKEGFQDTASFAEYVITMLKDKPNIVDLAQDQVADTINNMKPKIMKDLLTLFKHGNAGPVTSMIHHYRLIGVDWPEFAAIEKSLAANKKPKPLAEAASLETLLKYADKNISNMVPGDVASFYEVVLGLEKLAKGKTDAETNRLTVQVLFKHKAAILKQIDSLVNSKDDAINANAIFAIGLLKRIGVNWPEIQQTVDTRVADIINTVLTKFSLATALDIMKSAEHIGMSKAKIKPGIVAAGKKLLAEIEKMIDENPVNYFIENKFRLFSRLGVNYKIKDGVIKTKLLNGLDKYLAEQGLTPGTAGIVEILTKYSADPAKTLGEISSLMNKNKASIVKRLLQDFKNDNTYNLKDYLITLMTLKLNWPELDIIIRSVKSAPSTLYESVDAITANNAMNLLYRMIGVKYKVPHSWDRKEYEQFIDEHKTEIIEFLRQHAEKWGGEDITPVSSGLFMIMGLQFNGRDWPEIRDLLDQHRHDVMRMLLSTIKYEGGLLRYSKDIFTTLVAMGINWPELEVVKRSANSLSRRS